MNNKKGQFYIIAAIIIIIAIVGIVTITNYAKTKKEKTVIYDLGKDFSIETGYVYAFKIYSAKDTSDLISNWSRTYYNYSQGKENVETWAFVYGNYDNITAIYFSEKDVGQVCMLSGSCTLMTKTVEGGTTFNPECGLGECKIEIRLNNSEGKEINYPFELKEGENVFFVIKTGEAATTATSTG